MTAVRCRMCGKFWAFTGNPDLFEVISRYCPLCIPFAPHMRGTS
ncbi:hypothetical protein I5J42_gp43 [Mycobacterium phage GreaseLightnin]|uniref:Uncharacterized protein n=5 Tax=Caudoviricetes TaxID=2731619 RepID=A0A143FQV9_9CAUD|nr:hypothetical protein SEA_SHIPWRECK_45 [Mycobacterium phage Shipwreck]YP_009964531.1 hypothetical protein I5J42_gp43 [Mycobacterium phage GreaseLightnin]YP_009964611.1 hypothetical protein I5J43_gp43 [Mycobacterium phage Ksquared]YP_009964691.1 hypothetical protein I5J44_gp43 [Mycobacterium phage Phineas]ASD53708.1 hypothetical protein SEA_BOGIE_45 [Mycobacterium phage Bogie]QDH84999.1 hypothetical protein SEA_HUHILLTOP_43 [Mycobacterium phage HUHilltop]QDK01233.1 hypothetical protein SEA_B